MVLSLLGLIARPVVLGGVVEEVDDEEDDLDAEVDEEVLDADEEDEGGEPELSCLINSAARSDFFVSSRSRDLRERENDSRDRKAPTSSATIPGMARSIHPQPSIQTLHTPYSSNQPPHPAPSTS